MLIKVLFSIILVFSFHPRAFSFSQVCKLPNCIECKEHSVLFFWSYEECLKCSSSDYVLKSEKCPACTEAFNGCKTCEMNKCKSCVDGYTFNQKYEYCSECSNAYFANCATCSQKGCLTCRAGSFANPSTGTITSCQTNNCADWSNRSCLSCMSGYYFKDNLCKEGQCLEANCLQCGYNGCVKCKEGYVPLGRECKAGKCSDYYPNCSECGGLYGCLSCNKGYQKENGLCKKITIIDDIQDFFYSVFKTILGIVLVVAFLYAWKKGWLKSDRVPESEESYRPPPRHTVSSKRRADGNFDVTYSDGTWGIQADFAGRDP